MNITKRNPWAMVGLTIITFGLYMLYWLIVTKIELNEAGAEIPTAWLLIIPFGNLYFYYKFAQAFSQVVLKRGDEHTIEYFLLLLFLPLIGEIVCQIKMNKTPLPQKDLV